MRRSHKLLLMVGLLLLTGLILACGVGQAGVTDEPAPGVSQGGLQPGRSADGLAASSSTWQPAGFGGAGNYLNVYFDPNQPSVVYAASDVAGVYRSTDYGDHWEMRSVGLGNNEISSFAVDPFDSNTLYAGTGALTSSSKAGIYVSHDAGLTWQHLSSTFTNGITFRKYRTADAIAPDPAHQGVILSGSRENGIWRSTDSGVSWTQVYTAPLTNAPLMIISGSVQDDLPPPYPAPVSVVLFDPTNASVVYAGLDGFGVVKSTDSGVSWQPVNSGLPTEATVKYLAVGSGGVLYAALGTAGVYKSASGGNQWQAVNGSLPALGANTWVTSVAAHPTNPNTAYLTLATDDYAIVWKTSDGGATWVPKGDDPNTPGPDSVTYDPVNDPTETWAAGPALSWRVTLDPRRPDRLFYVGFWDILRSNDGGEHSAVKIVGAQNTCVTDLVVDTDHPAGQPDTLYATHMDAGLLASTDDGITWTMVLPQTWDNKLTGHYWRFATARVGATKYYYTTSDPWTPENYGQVLRSTDGVNWTKVFSNTRPSGTWMNGAMLGLAVDPSQPSTIYVTQDGGQVWKSTSNGDPGTWAPTASQPGGNSFTYALAVDDTGHVFAGTLLDGLWRSTDGGASWQQVLTQHSTILHLLAVPGAIYASSGEDANLYRSIDGGDTWHAVTSFSSVDDGDGVGDQGSAIAVDPNDSNHLFFSRMDTWHPVDASPGIVESTDRGVSWRELNNGLGLRNVSSLAVGPDGDLFAGTWCGGIWHLPAGAAPPTPTPTPGGPTPTPCPGCTPTPTPTATPTPSPDWSAAAVTGWNNLVWLGANGTSVSLALGALQVPAGGSIQALWLFNAGTQTWSRNLYFPDGTSSIQIPTVDYGGTFWILIGS